MSGRWQIYKNLGKSRDLGLPIRYALPSRRHVLGGREWETAALEGRCGNRLETAARRAGIRRRGPGDPRHGIRRLGE